MNETRWRGVYSALLARILSVDEITLAVKDLPAREISRIKMSIISHRAHTAKSFPDWSEHREQTEYYNLLLRVLTSFTPASGNAPKMIMDAQVNLVPVTWVDDGTTDAETNANVLRWVELNMVDARHLAVAKETNAAALHLFEPRAMNRRTAHVTTESFIRIMEKSK